VNDDDGGPRLSNAQSGNFKTNLVIKVVDKNVTVLEGWASIDVQVHGRKIRFITTHLDAFAPPIRLAQATEILRGPANTNMPIVLAGDMNTTSTTDTYAAISSRSATLNGDGPRITPCVNRDRNCVRSGLNAKRCMI